MKKFFIILFAGVLLGSCSETLDTDVNGYLTGDRKQELIETNPSATVLLIRANLSGVYDLLAKSAFNGNTRHDYFGLKSIHLATDLNGEDMVQDIHHHFGFDYNIDNREASYARTTRMWQMFYKMVSSSNTMLKDYYTEPRTEKELVALKAEILTIRGIAYYYLVNLYSQTYKGNENGLGVPILLSPDDAAKPRATVEEVYKQISSDLRFAVENGSVTDTKGDADKAVAAAYLAKAYAAQEKWDSCETYASIAVKGGSLKMSDNFAQISNPDWMWGYDINGETSTLYASFYSHIDGTIPGYAGMLGVTKSIHNLLYNKIPSTDSRRQLFINKEQYPEIAEKYPDMVEYANLKYVTKSDFSGDYCFLRYADPYLLLVESLIEQNKLAEAREKLDVLVKNYNLAYDAEAFKTQDELRQEVRFERKVELWGEGTSLFDLKRWKTGVKRNLPGTNHRVKIDVPAGDKLLIYQIPQTEVDANPNIVQND